MRTALSVPLAVAFSLAAAPAFAADWQPSPAGQVSMDAVVYHDAKPDKVNLSVSCSKNAPASRQVIREDFASIMKALSEAVGSNGTVRRSGVPSFYEYYGEFGRSEENFTGQINLSILDITGGIAEQLMDKITDLECTGSWDIRAGASAAYARQYKTELLAQIEDKKALYEELLGMNLTRVHNISYYTSMDGYDTFDPETGLLRAMTTMSVTFDLGNGVSK
jgi:hypothetical protein